uniref:C-type lectin domain-containing protein n=1 Tax=Lepisosteus oculatus TaxID=7918 RepID=W5MKD5_LEPOC
LSPTPYRLAAVCLGLLCAVLLIAIIALSIYYNGSSQKLTKELVQLRENYSNLTTAKNKLQVDFRNLFTGYSNLTESNDYLTTVNHRLQVDIRNLTTSYSNLTVMKDNLQKERDNLEYMIIRLNELSWTESRTACRKLHLGADLVIINSREEQCESKIIMLQNQRNIQNTYTSETPKKKSTGKKWSYRANEKAFEVKQDEVTYAEKHPDKVNSSYLNMLMTSAVLQNRNNGELKGQDQLRMNYSNLTAPKDKLQEDIRNLTGANERLLKDFRNLTAAHDKLQVDYRNLSAVKECRPCPWGWELFSHKCYYFSTDKLNWNDSRTACRKQGADLVAIDSRGEQEFVTKHMKRREYWMGLSDAAGKGTWIWVDGTQPIEWYWIQNQPGNFQNNTACLASADKAIGLKNWNDQDCSKKKSRICEGSSLPLSP